MTPAAPQEQDSALLPCPFCANVPSVSAFEFGGYPFWNVRCCMVDMPRQHSKSDAINKWNTRAALSAQKSAPVAASQFQWMNALFPSAEKYAESYNGDDRQDVKTDVLNAYYAGAEFGRRFAYPPAQATPQEQQDSERAKFEEFCIARWGYPSSQLCFMYGKDLQETWQAALSAQKSAPVAPVAWCDPTNHNPGQSVTFSQATKEQWPHLYPLALYAHPPAQATPEISGDLSKVRSRVDPFGRVIVVDPHPPAQATQEERNFCPRCGKRTKDIHTCTPPESMPAQATPATPAIDAQAITNAAYERATPRTASARSCP
jgi:hypothetical protein